VNVRKGLNPIAIVLGDEAHARTAFFLRCGYNAAKQGQEFLNFNRVFFVEDLLAKIPYAGVNIHF
jgi:hypothetical protein